MATGNWTDDSKKGEASSANIRVGLAALTRLLSMDVAVLVFLLRE